MNGLDSLRQRYPWPDEKPDVPAVLHRGEPQGWCHGENRNLFRERLGPETSLVLELGSWLGQSAYHILMAAPNAPVLCVDHWKGSAEHQNYEQCQAYLPVLFETFCVHHWDNRDRIVPMRTAIHDGMREVAAAGLVPSLVYVDGSHDTPSVKADVLLAMELFPEAFICGDDWCWQTVAAGVKEAIADRTDLRIRHGVVAWYLEKI